MKDFLNRFFGGSAAALVLGLVDAETLTPEELGELEARLSATTAEAEAGARSRTAAGSKRGTGHDKGRKGTG